MQTIQHPQSHISPLFTEFDKLYAYTSKGTNSILIPIRVDKSFLPLISLFKDYDGINYSVEYKITKYDKISVENNRNMTVCFSGGKDSTATALYYKNKGYNVTLYHLKGMNKTYKDEYINCQKVADVLKLPLVVEEIILHGNHSYTEHPMKNMIIANRALQYSIRNGLGTNIAFGNFTTSSLNNEPFDVCGGDCIEMWQAYEKVIRKIVPKFKMNIPFNDFTDTLRQIILHKEVAKLCQSCIGPYRYRTYLHNNNVKKYGIDIPENRCGSCWKCCLEYCIYSEVGIYEKNEEYYNHCIQVLKKTLNKETGQHNTNEQVEDHYFFYRKELKKWAV